MASPNNGGGAGDPNDPKSDPNWFGNEDVVNAMAEDKRKRPRLGDPIDKAQIERLFQDYTPPLYARARGYNRERSLALVEMVANAAMREPLGRPLTDLEMRAFAEHVLSGMNTGLAYRWGFTALAALLTYRSRKNNEFPLFLPLQGLIGRPFTGDRLARGMWHLARFGVYYTGSMLFVFPIVQTYNTTVLLSSIKGDPRLADVYALRDKTGGPRPANSTNGQAPSWLPQQAPDRTAGESYGTGNGVAAQAQAAWGASRQAQQSQSPERSDKWGTFPDVDDASPIAPSAPDSRGDSVNQGGISAWERIRQQSQSRSQSQSRQPPPQPQQSWQAPQGVGAGDDDANPPYRGPRDDSDSFSRASGEEAVATGKAEREFDEMLDREQRGAEQGQGPWGRR